jgi:hypothetical protein
MMTEAKARIGVEPTHRLLGFGSSAVSEVKRNPRKFRDDVQWAVRNISIAIMTITPAAAIAEKIHVFESVRCR